MTLAEWLDLTGTGNAAFAQSMNAARSVLTQEQAAATPMATEDRVSRLRLGRRRVTPGELVLIAHVTKRAVTAEGWDAKPAPKQKPGAYVRRHYGVWMVHCGGQPMLHTAHLTPDAAWAVAGFKPPVDAVAMQAQGYECRMVARFEPNRELRRVLREVNA